MRCPKCGYISFDYLDSCKKCGSDVSTVRNLVGLIAVPTAGGMLLESTGPMAMTETAADFEFSEGGQEEAMQFQFESGEEETVSSDAQPDEMDLTMEDDPIFDLSEEEEEVQEIQLDLSEMEEELSFEPELDLTSSDEGLGDMEFELDLPLDEPGLNEKLDLGGSEDLGTTGMIDEAAKDDLGSFSLGAEDELLNLDLEADEPAPAGVDMAAVETALGIAPDVLDENVSGDAALDLGDVDLERELSLDEPIVELESPAAATADPTAGIDMGDLNELSLEKEFEAVSGPYNLDDSKTDSDEVLGLGSLENEFDDLILHMEDAGGEQETASAPSGDETLDLSVEEDTAEFSLEETPELSLEEESTELSLEETPEQADLGLQDVETEGMLDVEDLESALADIESETAPKTLSPQDQIFADAGVDESVEDLSLEELSQDEIFKSDGAGMSEEEIESDLALESLETEDEEELVLDLDDSDDTDLDALAKDFEDGLEELEMETDLQMSDEEVYAAIPNKEAVKPEP